MVGMLTFPTVSAGIVMTLLQPLDSIPSSWDRVEEGEIRSVNGMSAIISS